MKYTSKIPPASLLRWVKVATATSKTWGDPELIKVVSHCIENRYKSPV